MKNKPHTIFVTGSRDLRQYDVNFIRVMLADIIREIQYANNKNIHVLCGDAHGIDKEVFKHCVAQDIPLTVYLTKTGSTNDTGRYDVMSDPHDLRNGTHKKMYVLTGQKEDHAERDNCMMDNADEMIAICINNSKGTARNTSRAKQENKRITEIHLP